jgi:hypothetical protein
VAAGGAVGAATLGCGEVEDAAEQFLEPFKLGGGGCVGRLPVRSDVPLQGVEAQPQRSQRVAHLV